MQCIQLPAMIVLMFIDFPSCESCAVEKIPTCEHYDLIKYVAFHGFIPANSLEAVCRQMLSAMACAYDRGRLNQCPSYKRLPFDTQQSVINTVCVHRRQEYLNSNECFSKHKLKSHITTECLQALTDLASSKDRCRTLTEVIECVRTPVLMTDGCNSTDSDLMRYLVQSFVRPSMHKFRCSTLVTKAGESKQEHAGDESSPGKINSAPVPNSARQQTILRKNLKTDKSVEGTAGEDVITTKYESQGTLPQYTSQDTTVTYLDDVTLSSQSISWTDTDDRHKDEQTSPEMTSPYNQGAIRQWQGSANGPEPATIKSSTKHSTNGAILAREHATSGIRPTVSTVPRPEGLDKTVMWATESSTLGVDLESTKHESKNTNRPMSQSNMTRKVMALKSTQRSGNDATTSCFSKPLTHMLLSSIISLVLFVK